MFSNLVSTASGRSYGLASAVALALLARPAQADLNPEWITNLPVGASLTAGIAGMVVDAAGVTYVTGITGPSTGTDVVTAAYDPDGILLWSQVFNGPGNWHDQARGIALGPGGVLYVTGNTPGPGSYSQVLLLKYVASTGALLNAIQYSSAPSTSEFGGSVATDALGNVYVGGGTVGDGGDGLILKFDASGALQWTRTWDGPASAPFSQDSVQQMKVDPDGDPIALIHGVMGTLHPDYVVLKCAPTDGSTVWQAVWGVGGGDFPREMEVDALGDVYVTGTGIAFTDKFSTIKLRGFDGALLWQAYDSAGLDDAASAIALDGQGGVYVTGSADPDGDPSNLNDNFYTVKRDAGTGALLWTHLYGANCIGCYDVPSDVLVDPAGNVFVAGSTTSPPYTADMITLVLDAGTGLETQRGVVSSPTAQGVNPRFLWFDPSYDLLAGADATNFNTGQVAIALVQYDSLVTGLYRFEASPLLAGATANFAVENATPLQMQFVALGVTGLGSIPIPALGVTLGISNPFLLAYGLAGAAGSFSFSVAVPPGLDGLTVWLQAVEIDGITPIVQRTIQ